jgi:hypothetical protein
MVLLLSAPVTQACNNCTSFLISRCPVSGTMIGHRFGDGNTSICKTHLIITTQGTYPVKLKVTDAAGCSDKSYKSSYIILSFRWRNLPRSIPCSVQFSYQIYQRLKRRFCSVYTGTETEHAGTNPLHNYPAIGKYRFVENNGHV